MSATLIDSAIPSPSMLPTTHGSAEDLIRDMTNIVDRFVAIGKAQVFQQRRRDRDFTIEQDKKLSQMKQTKKRLKEAQEKVEREREKEARQLALALQRVADVKLVEERLPKELDVLRRDLKTQERASTRLTALVSTKRAMAQVRSQELRKAVQCYADWLALTLEPVRDDKVRFVFTRLARSQPNRESYIVLQSDASGVTVDECEPQLGSALQSPLERLQKGGSLSAFLATVRRLFVIALQ